MKCPCHNCQLRTDICHSICKAYNNWCDKRKALKAKQKSDTWADRAADDFRIRQTIKTNHGK